MSDHDLDFTAEGAGPDAARRRDDDPGLSAGDIGRSVEAGRPDALGPGGLLHLQRMAGNSGVAALVAQRRASGDDAAEPDAEADTPSPVHDVVNSSGTPLDAGVRRDMEAAHGHDFGDVQIHTDTKAVDSTRSVQAHAYTVGNHIVFGEGRYQPDTAEGRHTLAHELTHVVQQREGDVDGTSAGGGIKVSDPGDRFEREAEANASRISAGSGGAAEAPPAPAPASVQRAEDADEPPVQRQAAGEEETEEPEAEAGVAGEAAAGADQATGEAGPAPEAAPGAEAAAPEAEAPAEVPAEAPTEAPEEEEGEEMSVSKLDQGISVQREGDDEYEEA
jgi:Domain of unknown function (DUF4157)